jgi:tRNA1(Val) A37 N6-methylase TrmN6
VSGAAGPATSCDGFLGGRLVLEQPVGGYRAGTDPVLLAAAVPAQAGESCLDLGCGVGTAALCLALRTGAICTGVELQADYAALARANATRNGLPLEVWEGDIAALPAALRQRSFDHVMLNPPYFAQGSGTRAGDAGRDLALRDRGDLAAWLGVAVRRTAPRGTVTVIARTDRLPDLLAGVPAVLGSLRLQPLTARTGRPAKRIILQGTKEGRAPFVLCPPFVLHGAERHLGDAEDLSAAARHILRDGGALPLCDSAL